MNKKFLEIGVFILLLTAIAGGGFWCWEENKEMQEQKKQEMAEQKQENAVESVQKENTDIKDKEQTQDDQTDLVWYEVPELRIKFQVEKWAKDDLGYVAGKTSIDSGNGSNSVYATFYPKSTLNEHSDECYSSKDKELLCWIFDVSRFDNREELRLKDGNTWQVLCPVKAKEFDTYSICYERHIQDPYYGMGEENYLQYKETHPKDIYFAVKFDTVMPL